MDTEDSGIFLFSGSKSKTRTVSEPVVEAPAPFLSDAVSEDQKVWKSRPKIRPSLPILTPELAKVIVVSGQDVIRMATIYAKTVQNL
jgi:hypothetical protein